MARARNIKPSIFKNEVLGVADPLYTILFEGLWVLADREGRLENRPLRIKAEVFPYREGLNVPVMLDWLEQQGFIQRYTAGGKACILIVNFTKHQNPHKNEAPSELPAPEGTETEVIGTTSEKIGSTRADSLSSDSLSLIPDTPPSAAAAVAATPAKQKQKTRMPEDFGISERVRVWAEAKGYGMLEQHLEALKRKCAANDYKKVSWDDFFMEAIREDWAKLRARAPNGAAPPPDVAKPRGPDPELERIRRESQQAVPIPLAVLERMAKIKQEARA